MIENHDVKVRYARQISLPEIGQEGQEKLSQARVLVVGAGGLGSPILLYLAGAGVGTLGVVDDDRVSLSNLHRQILYETGDVGRLKVESATDVLHERNPEVQFITYAEKLTRENAAIIIADYDIVVDGCDNFETRFLVNHTCFELRKTLVSGAVMGLVGQVYSFAPHLAADNPCYQCLYSALPPADATPKCSDAGVLGCAAGIVGSWQATEVIKEIVGCGEKLRQHMLVIDALKGETRRVKIPRDDACVCCGARR